MKASRDTAELRQRYQAAVAAGDERSALQVALAAWRINPAPSVARAVERVSGRLQPGVSPQVGRGPAEYQAAWLATAESDPDPATVGWLATHLMTRLPVTKDYVASVRFAALFPRLSALAKLGPDPRVATAFVAAITSCKVGFQGGDGLYRRMLALLEEQGDPRQIEALQAAAEAPRFDVVWARDRFSEVLRKFVDEAAVVDFGEVDGAAWSEAHGGAADEAALLQAIYDDPDDDDARAVYADALIERGDPRGEFISLQLADTSQSRKQARKILRDHGADWLDADLTQVSNARAFRRGFLAEFALRAGTVADEAAWTRAKNSPHLATVEAVHRGAGNKRHHEDFMAVLEALAATRSEESSGGA